MHPKSLPNSWGVYQVQNAFINLIFFCLNFSVHFTMPVNIYYEKKLEFLNMMSKNDIEISLYKFYH